MEENKSYHLRSLVLATTGGIVLSLCLALLFQHPLPLEKRNPSPGFGWSWDFDYESAMRDPHLTSEEAIGQATFPPVGQLILPLDEA
ncbi:MAG: hypothetical protein HZB24_02165, partial [Desulfobacterales bacterium]|nr:hypothetical protein [Desulfobacterales bacterium]